jgi:hypothetical protein
MAEPWIRVRALKTSLSATDAHGRRWPVLATDEPVWSPIPVSAYRRLRWTGLLSRNLKRVSGLGREYWIDEFCRREGPALASEVAADPARPVRRCGCSETRRDRPTLA